MEDAKQGQDIDSIVLEEEIDPNYVPTEAEVVEYAKWLGMDLDKDQDLFWIAREGLMAPLPPSWKPCKTKDTDDVYYFNFTTGESTWDHPCDGYYKRQYEEQKKKKEITNKDKSDTKKTQAKKDVSLLTGKEEKKQRKSFDLGTLKIPNVTSGGSLERKPLPGIAALGPAPLAHSNSLPAPINTKEKGERDRSDREVERLTGSASDGGLLAGKSKTSSKLLAAVGESDNKPQVSKSLDFKSEAKVESSFAKKLPKDRAALGKTEPSPVTTAREEKRSADSSSDFDNSPLPNRKLSSSPVQDTPSPPGKLHNPDREQLKIAQQNLASYRQSAEEREEKLRDRISSLVTENEMLKRNNSNSNAITDADVNELRAVKAENKKITESFQLKLLNQETESSNRISKLENEKKMIMIENERLTRLSQSPVPSSTGGDSNELVVQLNKKIQSLNEEISTLRISLLNEETRAASEKNESNRRVIELLEKAEASQLKLITQENDFLGRINKLESEKREFKVQLDSNRTSPVVQVTSALDSELVTQLKKKIELLEESAKKQSDSFVATSSSISESKYIIDTQKLQDEVDNLKHKLSKQEVELKNQIRRVEEEKRQLNNQVKDLNETISELQAAANTPATSSSTVRSESPELMRQLKQQVESLRKELGENEITYELKKIEIDEIHHKQVTELQQQLNEQKLKNLSLTKTISDLNMTHETDKATNQLEISRLNNTITQLEYTKTEKEKLVQVNNRADAEMIAQLRKKIDLLEGQVESAQSNATAKTEVDLKKALELARNNEQQYNVAKQEIDTLQLCLSNLRTEHAAHVSKLEANNHTLQALGSATDSETAMKLKSALQEHERDIHIIVDLQQQLEVSQSKVLTLQNDVAKMKEIEAEKSRLQTENSRLQTLNNTLVQANTSDDLRTQIITLQEQLRLKNIELNDEKMLHTNKISRLESEKTLLTVQLESERALVAQKDKNMLAYQEDLLQLQKKLDKKEDTPVTVAPPVVTTVTVVDNEEVSRLNVELSVQRAKFTALENELIKMKEVLKSKDMSIASYLQLIEELQSASLNNSIGLTESTDNGAATILNLRKSLNSKETEHKLLTTEHDVLNNRLINLQKECESYSKRWQDSEDVNLKLKAQHLNALKEKDSVLYQLESKCSSLQQSVFELNREVEMKKSTIEQMKSEIEDKAMRITAMENRIKLSTQSNNAPLSVDTAGVPASVGIAPSHALDKTGINSIIELSIALGKQQENMTRLEQQLLTMKAQPVTASPGKSKSAAGYLPSTSETDDSPDGKQHSKPQYRRSQSLSAAGSTPARVKFQEPTEKENIHNNKSKHAQKSVDDFHIYSSPISEDDTGLSLLPTTSEHDSSMEVSVDLKQRLRNLKTNIQKIVALESKQGVNMTNMQDVNDFMEEQSKILKLENVVVSEGDQLLRTLKRVIGKNQDQVTALKSSWKRSGGSSKQQGLSSRAINEQTKAVNDSMDEYKSIRDAVKNRGEKVSELKSVMSEVTTAIEGDDLRNAVKLIQKVQQSQAKLDKGVSSLMERLVNLNETVITFSAPSPTSAVKPSSKMRQPAFDDSFVDYSAGHHQQQQHHHPQHQIHYQPYFVNEAADFIATTAASRGPNNFYRSLSVSNPAAEAFLRAKPVDRSRISAQRHIENFERRQNATYKECDNHVNWLNNLQKELVTASHAVSVKPQSQFVARNASDVENKYPNVNYMISQASMPPSQVFHI